MNIDRSGLDAGGSLNAAAHEAVERRALFSSGGGGDVCSVKQKAQERSFAGALGAGHLNRVGESARRDLER